MIYLFESGSGGLILLVDVVEGNEALGDNGRGAHERVLKGRSELGTRGENGRD